MRISLKSLTSCSELLACNATNKKVSKVSNGRKKYILSFINDGSDLLVTEFVEFVQQKV